MVRKTTLDELKRQAETSRETVATQPRDESGHFTREVENLPQHGPEEADAEGAENTVRKAVRQFYGEDTAPSPFFAERAELERRRKISEYRSASTETVENLPPSQDNPQPEGALNG